MLRQQQDTAARRKEKPRSGGEKHTACAVPAGIPPQGGKRISLDCMSLLSVCADSRFAKPRNSHKKVLIVAVRKCHCGGLNRGLQNLEASRKGNGFILFALCKKNQKAHGAKPCDPRFKALSEETSQKFPATRVETGFLCKTAA